MIDLQSKQRLKSNKKNSEFTVDLCALYASCLPFYLLAALILISWCLLGYSFSFRRRCSFSFEWKWNGYGTSGSETDVCGANHLWEWPRKWCMFKWTHFRLISMTVRHLNAYRRASWWKSNERLKAGTVRVMNKNGKILLTKDQTFEPSMQDLVWWSWVRTPFRAKMKFRLSAWWACTHHQVGGWKRAPWNPRPGGKIYGSDTSQGSWNSGHHIIAV